MNQLKLSNHDPVEDPEVNLVNCELVQDDVCFGQQLTIFSLVDHGHRRGSWIFSSGFGDIASGCRHSREQFAGRWEHFMRIIVRGRSWEPHIGRQAVFALAFAGRAAAAAVGAGDGGDFTLRCHILKSKIFTSAKTLLGSTKARGKKDWAIGGQ